MPKEKLPPCCKDGHEYIEIPLVCRRCGFKRSFAHYTLYVFVIGLAVGIVASCVLIFMMDLIFKT